MIDGRVFSSLIATLFNARKFKTQYDPFRTPTLQSLKP
ncbi:hypothetical protein NMYAN_20209 [Nitrosomonas nitrosa]|uniref:Uncharacterized protein n=1 Tax=Nitrosomonas nitrosa TaxID=52442 RepID=A0A8H8YYX1_9PROT|nr:hypothetical protein NMYAN_20209 [Nitrosomonas nitrosa]